MLSKKELDRDSITCAQLKEVLQMKKIRTRSQSDGFLARVYKI